MTIVKNSTKTMIQFRINERRGSEFDETERYLAIAQKLTEDFIPHSVSRFAFVSDNSDDFIWSVTISNDMMECLPKNYFSKNEKTSRKSIDILTNV